MYPKKLAYKIVTDKHQCGIYHFIEGIKFYDISMYYSNTISSLLQHTTFYSKIALVEVEDTKNNHTTYLKVIKIMSYEEVNNTLLEEYRKVSNLYPCLILTGSLALHMYQPLPRNINNVDAIIDATSLKEFSNEIHFDIYNDSDSRSWGILYVEKLNMHIKVLVKNNIKFNIIDGIKISDIKEILFAKLYYQITKPNVVNEKDIWNYVEFLPEINNFIIPHEYNKTQYHYLNEELPF